MRQVTPSKILYGLLVSLLAGLMGLSGLATASSEAPQDQVLAKEQNSKTENKKAPKTSKKSEKPEKSEKKSSAEARAERLKNEIGQKFAPTGQETDCISSRRIRDSVVIDDQTIFFYVTNNVGYFNHIPQHCSLLGSERRFSYNLRSTTQLCRGEIITVFDSFGRSWGSCSLGSFEEWRKIKTEPEDDTAEQGLAEDEEPEGESPQ